YLSLSCLKLDFTTASSTLLSPKEQLCCARSKQ
ncbi:hypothetical protein A2U01_0103523, partial [Trifolium medium]|nr:hypothetical protein [Trifolium medium]